jgi:hypothetical protein
MLSFLWDNHIGMEVSSILRLTVRQTRGRALENVNAHGRDSPFSSRRAERILNLHTAREKYIHKGQLTKPTSRKNTRNVRPRTVWQ